MAICSQCGQREADKNSHMCKLCLAGAPVSMAPRPGVYAGSAAASVVSENRPTAAQSSTSSSASSTSDYSSGSTSTSTSQSDTTETAKPAREKRTRTPRDPSDCSGERNIFAILGFILAFCHPLCGLAVCLAGVFEARKTGTGLILAVFGFVISLILIAGVVYLFVSGMFKELLGL